MLVSSADIRKSIKLDREKKFENLDNNNVSGFTLARTKVRLEMKRFQISGRVSGALVLLSLHSPLSVVHGLTEWLLVFLLCKYGPRVQSGYQTEWGLQLPWFPGNPTQWVAAVPLCTRSEQVFSCLFIHSKVKGLTFHPTL